MNKQITAYILAGGKSSRMGADKGLTLLNGQPVISYIVNTVSAVFEKVKIITSEQEYKKTGLEIIPDIIPEQGPMGGIYTALSDSPTKKIFIISCDMPFIQSSTIIKLINSQKEKSIITVYKQRIQPLLAVYTKDLLPSVKGKIAAKDLKMINFIVENQLDIIEMGTFVQAEEFRNLNTRQELEEAEKILKK